MTQRRLTALREAMRNAGVSAYLQPVHDEYLNEYAPACHRRVEWLCGFSGSAGMLVVTLDKAALFVDGRYTLQAAKEVDGSLFEIHNSADVTPEKWLGDAPVAYDPALFTRAMLKRLPPNARLISNLIDAIWQDRPPVPASEIYVHELCYAGESHAEKRARIAEEIGKASADAAVINAPDSVCWLLNIRASDVTHTPLLLAPMIVEASGRVQLFVEPKRAESVLSHLGNEVVIYDPAQLAAQLAALGGKKILCDPASLPVWFISQLEAAGAKIIEGADPCQLPKACKNAVEIAGIKAAHIRDGKAIIRLLAWLDRETKNHSVTEMDVAEKLLALRKQNEGFVEPSFSTIAGSGPNGAIVHYRATAETNRTLKMGELLLLDSGGQYPDGTTDVTRTVPIGAPSPEHKDCFTRVLKGHIAIATARFPVGTKGSQLDTLARQYLWQAELDYDHGTGHGVGCFLGVHEGPQRISKRSGDAALAAGMVVSNEPGYYKEGAYGIRIENLVAVTKCPHPNPLPEGERIFLRFETLTCVPIDTRLVEVSMLTEAEKKWLGDYHAWVLGEQLCGLDSEEAAWLKTCCASI